MLALQDNPRPAVLVTGGAGYIGSHVCQALCQAGYMPVAYDNLTYGDCWPVIWGPFEKGDMLDRARLDGVLFRYAPVAIMHFAAFANEGAPETGPGENYRNNVAGSLTLLEAARDRGLGYFVFSSSCAIYGIPDRLPVGEESPLRPVSLCGAAKLVTEFMLSDFEAAHGLKWAALRYFNAAGAGPSVCTGEGRFPETQLIPLVLDAVAGRRKAVAVWGTDYDTPDGTCVRDYVHVSDIADAHVKALEALLSGSAASGAYNLGLGHGFSVREVIKAAERVTGLSVPLVEGARRPGDPAQLVADAAKAGKDLGWRPQTTELSEIIETAWAWHQRSKAPGRDRRAASGATDSVRSRV